MRCGYCGIDLDNYPNHDVHWCKKDDSVCRYCRKDITEQDDIWEIDHENGNFCSIECKEKQRSK